MIDPRTVMLAIPCYDGKVMSETAGGLQASGGLFAAVSMPAECSHVGLARNLIAGQFLQSNYEWLICVDSDIVFTRGDLQLLLQPCDREAVYFEDSDENDPDIRSGAIGPPAPRPTRIGIAQSTDRADLNSKTIAAADVLVCAEYSFKDDSLNPVKLGMGFVRIHRSVFRTLEALKHDGGPTIEVGRQCLEQVREGRSRMLSDPAGDPGEFLDAIDNLILSVDDKAGQPRLWQTSWKGRMYYDYFPSGPIMSQFVPTAEWKGEDHGFFTLCMLAGIIPRIETRTRLIHMGRKAYPYLGPDLGGGQ